MTYEALLLVAVYMTTLEQSEELQAKYGDTVIHPLAIETVLLLQRVWQERRIRVDFAEVGEHCFDEVGMFLAKPVAWSSAWLDAFLDDKEAVRRLSSAWADQWQVDFEVMRTVVGESV